jgi:hypothetical protein
VNSGNLFIQDKDFSVFCKPGFDVGVFSLNRSFGIFRPGSVSTIDLKIGDMAGLYNLNCAPGLSGTVTVIINGPATFLGVLSGTPSPLVVGDTLMFSIPDYATFGLNDILSFNVQIDTLAQLGDQVCFDVFVTPVAGDNNPSNNFYNHCFVIVNSYDPNDKQVSPFGLTDTSQYWLTYTVRFQNTGNAPAQHVYILDSLDQFLDETSIQLLDYSHEPFVQVIGKVVKFNFPNINLPDSVNNEPDSHGYVQFKVKRFGGLPIGTQIQNTAYIFFDFNPPIKTNTTTNVISVTNTVGANEQKSNVEMAVYPNPISTGSEIYIDIKMITPGQGVFRIFEIGGREVFSKSLNLTSGTNRIGLHDLAPGVYLSTLETFTSRVQRRLVVIN